MAACNNDEPDSRDMLRLAKGEDAALNDLMERHAQRIFHYLLRALQNEEDAADLAQETFVKVYQNRGKFDSRQKFTSWLYTIAGNLVRDRYRWRLRHPQVSIDVETSPDEGLSIKDSLAAESPTPGETLLRAERSQAVRVAIGSLPLNLREPLILAAYEGLSQIEIGSILGCSAKAIETRIHRARTLLREKLVRAGHS